MKHNAEIALRALLNDIPVTFGDKKYVVGVEENSGQTLACVIIELEVEGELKEHICDSQLSLTGFIRLCEQMTEEERIGLVGALGLKKGI